MNILHGIATAALWTIAVIGGAVLLVAGKVVLDLATKEVTGQIDRLPMLILKLALLRLPAEQRERYRENWQPELTFILKELDSRPISRVLKGLWFATSLLIQAAHMRRALGVADRRPRWAMLSISFVRRLILPLGVTQGAVVGFSVASRFGWSFVTAMILAAAWALSYFIAYLLRVRSNKRRRLGRRPDQN